MLSSHVCPSFSHCYLPLPAGEEEEDKQGGRRKKEEGKAEAKEEVKKAPQSKAEGKKAEGKKVEATVVPPPLDGDGNPIDTEACTVTFIEEVPAGPRKRSKRG